MSDRGYALGAAWQTQGSSVVSVAGDDVVVEDPTDFDSSGRVDIDGTRYAYTRDPDALDGGVTLTLDPTPTGVDAGDTIAPVLGGQIVRDLVVYVSTDDEGDPAEIIVDYGQRDLWIEGDYDPPIPVTVSDDLTKIEDAPGMTPVRDAGMSNLRFKALDSHIVTTLGDQTMRLTYQPVAQSEHLRWDGASQEYDDFTRDGYIVTVPDPDGALEIGDVLTVQYVYTDATGPNLLSIPMGTVWKYANGLGSSTTYAGVAFDDSSWAEALTPLEAPLYISPGNVWQRISGVSTGGDLTFTMTKTDNQTKVYLDGVLIFSATSWSAGPAVVTVPCAAGSHVVAVYSVDTDGPTGIGQGTGIEIQEH